MKIYLFLFGLFCSFSLLAKGPQGPSYTIIESKLDSNLSRNKSVFTFLINANDLYARNGVLYSDNGVSQTGALIEESFDHETNPGNHRFQFVLTDNFFEIYTDSIYAAPGHRITVQLNFRSSDRPILVKKPVIYLYPQEKTEVDISLNTKGDLFFTYPSYDSKWSVTANPDGEITVGPDSYNYLFWESEQRLDYSIVDFSSGSIVSRDHVLSFIEGSLQLFGLNTKEKSDFITYWVPQMIESNYLYIYFVFDDKCNAFAELNINPKPDNLGRIYMLWSSVEEDEIIDTTPQEIPVLDRDGFTVIEWGGAEIEMINSPQREL